MYALTTSFLFAFFRERITHLVVYKYVVGMLGILKMIKTYLMLVHVRELINLSYVYPRKGKYNQGEFI